MPTALCRVQRSAKALPSAKPSLPSAIALDRVAVCWSVAMILFMMFDSSGILGLYILTFDIIMHYILELINHVNNLYTKLRKIYFWKTTASVA
jgi:hypothetical protein